MVRFYRTFTFQIYFRNYDTMKKFQYGRIKNKKNYLLFLRNVKYIIVEDPK